MNRADNSAFLAQANARRHEAALAAARHAINQLQRQGRAVSFSTVARSAGVSRGWLYRQDQIRDLISQQRTLTPPAARRATAQRATADSLRQRLDAARAEITRLRTENRSLREQLARHLGLQRTQHSQHTSAEPQQPDHDPCHGCGEDMSTPQNRPPTRHYLQTTLDNRRSVRRMG